MPVFHMNSHPIWGALLRLATRPLNKKAWPLHSVPSPPINGSHYVLQSLPLILATKKGMCWDPFLKEFQPPPPLVEDYLNSLRKCTSPFPKGFQPLFAPRCPPLFGVNYITSFAHRQLQPSLPTGFHKKYTYTYIYIYIPEKGGDQPGAPRHGCLWRKSSWKCRGLGSFWR